MTKIGCTIFCEFLILTTYDLAKACTGLSLIGIVFLLVLSYLFSIEAETLMHDLVGSGLTGKQVAKTCLGAVVIYAVCLMNIFFRNSENCFKYSMNLSVAEGSSVLIYGLA